MRVHEAGGAVRVGVIEAEDGIVRVVVARTQHCEAAVELHDDRIAPLRVHRTVQRAERTVAGETGRDAVHVPIVYGEAVARDQFANGLAVLEAAQSLFDGPRRLVVRHEVHLWVI